MDGKIILRALEPSDVDLLYNWENNRELWKVSNTVSPFSKYILQKYIENSHFDIYQTKQLRLMIDVIANNDKRTIGAVDLFDFDPFHLRAGVGILIASEDDRNKGMATQALKEIIDYSFETLCLHQIFCNITVDNQPSIRIFEKLGFIVTGNKKEWIKTQNGFVDELILQLVHNK